MKSHMSSALAIVDAYHATMEPDAAREKISEFVDTLMIALMTFEQEGALSRQYGEREYERIDGLADAMQTAYSKKEDAIEAD